ncbi:BZ3500_MvSof-1268-A1-R1_Chr9g10882 [Microbotryum saponariae]|uniref:BZ3500_MvSof-1268-A1-R1_Chr9g10882 protein n=1 Tax=Microbotryum saponariae TaxID=289078 RepID=A0A2X0KCG3_9BASI|nr:BZ3501_MvSof-1269-A2-R1_Chr9g10630 [Microbotryum saponariae]SDA00856.1 BZ3500_MvSof-1268-A1-R1_Chr9g10882 [Microbotryum saponariae]
MKIPFISRRRKDSELETTNTLTGRPPFLLGLRSSTPYIALTVGVGVLVDLSGYGLVVPVVPFRLEALGYDNVGSKTGWLVAAYAAGLIVSSPPIAYVGGRFKDKRTPLLIALGFMAAAVVLFMETSSYSAMLVSRVLQGISGTGIWTLGLALVTDSVPEARVGIIMGYVMVGFTVGQLIGPPVGGVLYERMGYRAPFVFALCLIFVDFVLRLFVIEKRTALKWIRAGRIDLPNFEAPGYTNPNEKTTEEAKADGQILPGQEVRPVIADGSRPASIDSAGGVEKGQAEESERKPATELGPWAALKIMTTSMRPVTLFALTLLNGITLGGLLDTGMTLHLNDIYGLDSLGAGLVFIGLIVPSFVASPFAGWASDRYGAKGIATIGMLLTFPGYLLLIINGPLPLTVFFLVILGFALSFFLTPVTQDLSVVVQNTPGLPSTYAYGAFNMMYSIGSFIGPIITGQIIEGLGIRKGWIVTAIICAVLSAVLTPFTVIYVGGMCTWFDRFKKSSTQQTSAASDATTVQV